MTTNWRRLFFTRTFFTIPAFGFSGLTLTTGFLSSSLPILQVDCAEIKNEETTARKNRPDHPIFVKTPALPRAPAENDEKQKNSGQNNSVWDNPAILIFSSATVVALIYMTRASFRGHHSAMLKGMQYRIVAQFLTFAACIVGAFIYAIKRPNEVKAKENTITTIASNV